MVGMSKDALLEMFRELFAPGRVVLIVSEMGGGKTSTALYFSMIMAEHFNYYILSNIVLKRRLSDAEDGGKRWERTKYPRYNLVRSFSELFYVMAKIRIKDPSARFLFTLDEPVASGIGAHFSVFGKKMTGLIQFLTLLRKLGLSVIFTTLSSSLLPTQIRKKGGAFLSGIISKEKVTIRKYAGHLLRKYDERAICILEMPAYGPGFEILITEVEGLPLVTPEEDAKVGAVIFDSLSPASWSMGVLGSGSRARFVMEHFLSYVSNRLAHEIPGATLTYFEQQGDVGEEFEMEMSIVEASKPLTKGTKRWREELVFPMLREAKDEITKKIGHKQPSLSEQARRSQTILKKQGVDLSLSSLRNTYLPNL